MGVRATKTKTLLQEAVQAGHVPKARRPYAVFFAEQCAMMLPSAGCRQTHRNHVSRIGASWRSLSPAAREKYNRKSAEEFQAQRVAAAAHGIARARCPRGRPAAAETRVAGCAVTANGESLLARNQDLPANQRVLQLTICPVPTHARHFNEGALWRETQKSGAERYVYCLLLCFSLIAAVHSIANIRISHACPKKIAILLCSQMEPEFVCDTFKQLM